MDYLKRAIVLFFLITLAQILVWELTLTLRVAEEPSLNKLNHALDTAADIVYFGDSVFSSTSAGEENQTKLRDMFGDYLPQCTIGTVAHGAFHLGAYRTLINYVAQHHYTPQLVVIPINLRSFGPSWSQRPSYQFYSLQKFVQEIDNPFYRFFDALNDDDQVGITEQQYLSTQVFQNGTYIGLVEDFDPYLEATSPSVELQANVAAMNYLYQLTSNHKYLIDLLAIVEIAQENNIPILFYITPIDVKQGSVFHGSQFRHQVEANIEIITNILDFYGVPMINLAFDLDHNYFDYQYYMNEHLLYEGRSYVAQHIADRIADIIECSES